MTEREYFWAKLRMRAFYIVLNLLIVGSFGWFIYSVQQASAGTGYFYCNGSGWLTDGPDVWDGTGQPDYCNGLAGADSMGGGQGGDDLHGGNGNDFLEGNEDPDLLFGEGGPTDFLYGNGSNDTLKDVDGYMNGYLNGGNGNDVCRGDWDLSSGEHDTFWSCEDSVYTYHP